MNEGERIAKLEQRADDSDTDQAALVEKVNAIAADVHEIKEKLSNWKGFFSGVMFTIATLAGLIGAGITALWNHLSR